MLLMLAAIVTQSVHKGCPSVHLVTGSNVQVFLSTPISPFIGFVSRSRLTRIKELSIDNAFTAVWMLEYLTTPPS